MESPGTVRRRPPRGLALGQEAPPRTLKTPGDRPRVPLLSLASEGSFSIALEKPRRT